MTYAFIAMCVVATVLVVMLARAVKAFEREHYAHLDELASMRDEATKERSELLTRIQHPERIPTEGISPAQRERIKALQEREVHRQEQWASVGSIVRDPGPSAA